MIRDEVKKIIAKLTILYPHFTVGETVGGLKPTDVWMEMIGDMDFDKADTAVKKCAQRCKFPPTIADIREEYEKIMSEEKQKEAAVKEFYNQARNYYPGSGEYGYGWKEWQDRLNDDPSESRVEASRWLLNRIVKYVNSCESETMDFAEAVSTI